MKRLARANSDSIGKQGDVVSSAESLIRQGTAESIDKALADLDAADRALGTASLSNAGLKDRIKEAKGSALARRALVAIEARDMIKATAVIAQYAELKGNDDARVIRLQKEFASKRNDPTYRNVDENSPGLRVKDDKVNELLGPGVAQAVDGGSVRVSAPMDPSQRVDYLSILENLEIDPGQAVAKVIINSRTGTIVIGQNVKVSPAAVTHGSLTVTITEDPIVSQPGPLSNGQTAVVPRSRVNAQQEAKPMFKFGPGTTLDEIVRAVNQVGAAPGDLMAILEALKQAGALQADLIVI